MRLGWNRTQTRGRAWWSAAGGLTPPRVVPLQARSLCRGPLRPPAAAVVGRLATPGWVARQPLLAGARTALFQPGPSTRVALAQRQPVLARLTSSSTSSTSSSTPLLGGGILVKVGKVWRIFKALVTVSLAGLVGLVALTSWRYDQIPNNTVLKVASLLLFSSLSLLSLSASPNLFFLSSQRAACADQLRATVPRARLNDVPRDDPETGHRRHRRGGRRPAYQGHHRYDW